METSVIIHGLPAWLAYIALALCIGLLACRLWVLPSGDPGSFGRDFLARTGSLFCISIVVMTAASMIDLLVRAVDMSGRPAAEAFALLPAVLFKTHYGRVWFLRMAALFVISAAMIAGGKRRDSRGLSVFVLALFVVVAITESATGHAADAGDFSLPEAMDLLHLLSACLWGGGLFVLSFSLLPGIDVSADDGPRVMAGVAARFSAMAGIAVAAAAVTAVYNALQYVGGVEGLLAAPYGWIVIAKIVIFFILLQLGGFNRYINVPLLRRWAGDAASGEGLISRTAIRFFEKAGGSTDGQGVAGRFRHSVRVEALLIVAILLCAAMLRHEIPARHHAHMLMQRGQHTAPMGGHQGHSEPSGRENR